MSSSLFHQIVFGPVQSRRLGVSLGVNLLPTHGKWCNFNCIYCECGWNEEERGRLNKDGKRIPSTREVSQALAEKLSEMARLQTLPDVITFSGNGEPTLHPDFKGIIKETLSLRSQYAPNAKVCVLSNATQLGRPDVFEALLMVDKRILKVDSPFSETIYKINQPTTPFTLSDTINYLKRFHGDFVLQTLFLRGLHHGSIIDNTTPLELHAWLDLLLEIKPKEVMIYTIDRKTPAKELVKVPLSELESIGDSVRLLQRNIQIHIAG